MEPTIQYTLAIIKPDAVRNNHIGEIIQTIEQSGLRIIGLKIIRLSNQDAARFYSIHKEKPFFNALIEFMCSGDVVILALHGSNAVSLWRNLMGATDPSKASEGSLRKLFGSTVTKNACHGSDSETNADIEIKFFFSPFELLTV